MHKYLCKLSSFSHLQHLWLLFSSSCFEFLVIINPALPDQGYDKCKNYFNNLRIWNNLFILIITTNYSYFFVGYAYLRAETVHQQQKSSDPQPQLVDILDLEEYVRRATITTTTSFCPPAACVQPQQLTSEDLCIPKLIKESL